MAGIDYTIPGQFKGIQLESPMNAMAQAMQLRGLQESSQMNALKAQEYQQQQQEKNALAQLMADTTIPYGSDAFFRKLATISPRSYESIASGVEKRQTAEAQQQLALSTKQQREQAIQDAARKDKEARRGNAFRYIANAQDFKQAASLVERAVRNGDVSREEADDMLAPLYASGQPDMGQFRANVLTGLLPAKEALTAGYDVEKAALDVDKAKQDFAKAKFGFTTEQIDTRRKQFDQIYPAISISSEADVETRLRAQAADPILGPLIKEFGSIEELIARDKKEFRANEDGYKNRLAGVSIDKILGAAEEKEQAAFSQDQLNRVLNKQPLISFDQWRALQRSTQTAPAPDAAAVAPAAAVDSKTVAMPTNVAVTTEDGSKKLGEVPVVADVSGVDFLDPTAQALYTLASNPRNKDRATALRDMADKIQAEHAKRLEEKRAEERKSTTLSGDFINVTVAEDTIAELEKNPTPLNLRKIANLRAQIKAANEGKGTKVQVGVKLPPQENAFEIGLGSGQAKTVLENKAKAEDARDMLDTVSIGRNILKSGAITGAGADFFVGLNQALKTAGVDFGYADASANSQAYTANMAQNVGKLIKLFGAGTGLSNSDRDYAEKMAAGKISLDRKALERILDIQERAARNVIKRHNKSVEGVKTNIPLTVDVEESAAAKPIPRTNAKGWVLKVDKNGRQAYVSPDGKQFEEVK
jgi:hypothetical protein